MAAVTLVSGRRLVWYGKSRAEVAQRLAEALRAQGAGVSNTGMRLRTGAYLLEWLETTKPNVRSRTWARYEQLIRLHALPVLSRTPLARLGPQDLQRCYAAAAARGSSPMTVRHLHMVLHRALRQAEQWQLLPRSPAALLDPPRAPRTEMQVLDPDQVRTLLAAAHGERLEAVYVLALATGMRQGELLALHWRDVDLEDGTLAVTGSLQRTKEAGLTVVEPKTARSRRRVELGEAAVTALRTHRTRQLAERLRAGSAWADQDLVFPTVIGTPLQRDHLVRRGFDPLLARAGLPRIRFHDLRHTAATLMLRRGIHPKLASEALGHASVGITLDTYSHVTRSMHREAAGVLDAVLAETPADTSS